MDGAASPLGIAPPSVLGEVQLAPETLLVALLAIHLGGLVVGVNGFGFAAVGTGLLAALLDSRTAVTVMILPVLAANASLVGELDRDGLSSCAHRFWLYVTAATVGTVAGMLFLREFPTRPLALALGVFVILYVAMSQRIVPRPSRTVRERCFVESGPAKAALGAISGAIFGATNVGIQVVAYLRSCDLDRSTFVGVVAMIFLGVSTVRVMVAGALGLYADGALVLSIGAVGPGLLGVALGKRVRHRIPERYGRASVFVLLLLVGLRLTLRGLGIA
jgi:uncharacterized membrane protein YfcA